MQNVFFLRRLTPDRSMDCNPAFTSRCHVQKLHYSLRVLCQRLCVARETQQNSLKIQRQATCCRRGSVIQGGGGVSPGDNFAGDNFPRGKKIFLAQTKTSWRSLLASQYSR